MLGASAGWVLPYSYQCNLMVMAAGKYRTADFIRIGLPYHVSAFTGLQAGQRLMSITWQFCSQHWPTHGSSTCTQVPAQLGLAGSCSPCTQTHTTAVPQLAWPQRTCILHRFIANWGLFEC